QQATVPFVFPKTLRFSPDGKRFGCSVGLNGDPKPPTAAVIDGKQGPTFDEFRPNVDGANIYFSPDSQRVAYVGERGGKTIAVVDGVEGKPHAGSSGIGGVMWSRNGKRWGICVADPKTEKGFVVVDDKEGRVHDMLAISVATDLAGTTTIEEFA